jgi:hypothetical protein
MNDEFNSEYDRAKKIEAEIKTNLITRTEKITKKQPTITVSYNCIICL